MVSINWPLTIENNVARNFTEVLQCDNSVVSNCGVEFLILPKRSKLCGIYIEYITSNLTWKVLLSQRETLILELLIHWACCFNYLFLIFMEMACTKVRVHRTWALGFLRFHEIRNIPYFIYYNLSKQIYFLTRHRHGGKKNTNWLLLSRYLRRFEIENLSFFSNK